MTKIIWGASGGTHDASLCVVRNNELVFASSTERYSRIKNDKNFNNEIFNDAFCYGYPDEIIWYESPRLRQLRNIISDYRQPKYPDIDKIFPFKSKIRTCKHHISHLCSALYTAPFTTNKTLGVVIDSVGEFTTTSFWSIDGLEYKKLETKTYPNSLGLFYSAVTQLIGLKPQEEEYIMMGMSAYGNNEKYYEYFKKNFFDQKYNLTVDLRRGCGQLFTRDKIESDKFDIALGAQRVYEEALLYHVKYWLHKTKARNLILSGGCILNCLANSKLPSLVDNIWIFPNPGDSGAAVGAALSYTNEKIELENMFLGHDVGSIIDEERVVNKLKEKQIIGVMNGKAEFGPRALGNRSILADPRNNDIKEKVNDIKGREQFRPFAPIVLEEFAHDVFDMFTSKSPYMSYAIRCKTPELYPATTHVDGTSRIQTVSTKDGFIYRVLLEWYRQTGCPVLLNTSLNTKGRPLLNKIEDTREFFDTRLEVLKPVS